MLHVDAPEGYGNISLKVIAGLRWLVRQPFTFGHVLKTDDDTFVCVGALLRFLLTNQPLYAGLADHGTHQTPRRVITRHGHKWSDATYATVFGKEVYDDYMQGVGYSLSSGLARTVVRNADALQIGAGHAPSVEDALIGTLARYSPPGEATHGVRLAANRSLDTELLVPTVQWVQNVSASCALGFLLVHKLSPSGLEQCARAAVLSPPYCHVRPASLVGQSARHVAHDRSFSGAPQRCACNDYRERVRPATRVSHLHRKI